MMSGSSEIDALRGRGGLGRRRRGPRPAARPAGRRPRRRLPGAAGGRPRVREAVGGAPFPLSERHGAWRVALDGGAHGRLHAAAGADRGRSRQPRLRNQRHCGAGRQRRDRRPVRRRGDLARAVAPVRSHPSSRTTRCGYCEPCGSRTSFELARSTRETEELLRRDARQVRRGPRAERPRRHAERDLAERAMGRYLDGSTGLEGWSRWAAARRWRLDRWDAPEFRLVAVFGERLRRFPVSNDLRRLASSLCDARAVASETRIERDQPLRRATRALGRSRTLASTGDEELGGAPRGGAVGGHYVRL